MWAMYVHPERDCEAVDLKLFLDIDDTHTCCRLIRRGTTRNVPPSNTILIYKEDVRLHRLDSRKKVTSSVMATSMVRTGSTLAPSARGASLLLLLLCWLNPEEVEHAALNTSLPSALVVTRACRPSVVVATMARPGGMARLRPRKPAAQSVCSPSTHSC